MPALLADRRQWFSPGPGAAPQPDCRIL